MLALGLLGCNTHGTAPLGAPCMFECGESSCHDPCAPELRCSDYVGDCTPVCAQNLSTGVCRRPCERVSDCADGCACSWGLCELAVASACAGQPCGEHVTRCGNRVMCLCDGG